MIECYYVSGEKELANQFTKDFGRNSESRDEKAKLNALETIIRILAQDNADKKLWDYIFEK